MVTEKRRCKGKNQDSRPCGQPPLRDKTLCFWHDPDHADEAREARRLGGQRRKREHTVAGAFEFEGLESVPDLRRLLQIAAVDALSLENSVARVRALIAIVQSGSKLLETGELEERVAWLEARVGEGEA